MQNNFPRRWNQINQNTKPILTKDDDARDDISIDEYCVPKRTNYFKSMFTQALLGQKLKQIPKLLVVGQHVFTQTLIKHRRQSPPLFELDENRIKGTLEQDFSINGVNHVWQTSVD